MEWTSIQAEREFYEFKLNPEAAAPVDAWVHLWASLRLKLGLQLRQTKADSMTSVMGEERVYLVIMPRSANWSLPHAVSSRGGDGAWLLLAQLCSDDCVGLASNITWDAWKNRVEVVYGRNVTYL